VHTLFLRYPLDVAFLDEGGRVLQVATLAPWRIGPRVSAATAVLELRAGEAKRLGLAPGAVPSLRVQEADASRARQPRRPGRGSLAAGKVKA
jgi:uncharacterized membrane protein (UPF0127 family)